MIEKLTQTQISRIPEFVQKWTDIGLSKDPADRPRAEAAIAKMYRIAWLKVPKVVWSSSPLANGLTRAIANVITEIGENGDSIWNSVLSNINDGVWDSIRDSVSIGVGDNVRESIQELVLDIFWANLRASVLDSVWDNVRDSVRDSVSIGVGDNVRVSVRDGVLDSIEANLRASVLDSVWIYVSDSIRASVRNRVESNVRDSVRASILNIIRDNISDLPLNRVKYSSIISFIDNVQDSVGDSVWGQHDAYLLANYDYFYSVCSLRKQTKKLIGLKELAQSAGWALPHQNICWVSERHNVLHLDARGRLHYETGPALSYPDGWSIYAVHGVIVPEWIIEKPEIITSKKIHEERNIEIRRVMLDKFGWDNYLRASDARLINADGWGDLYRVDMPDDEPLVMVRLINTTPDSTGELKSYFLRVPPSIKTAEAAVAWLGGFELGEFEYVSQS